MNKTIDYYRSLPYTRLATPVDEGDGSRPYWVAYVVELTGCKTDGASKPEAMRNLDDAFDEFIEAKLAWGSAIPEPARIPHGKPIARGRVVAQWIQKNTDLEQWLAATDRRVAVRVTDRGSERLPEETSETALVA